MPRTVCEGESHVRLQASNGGTVAYEWSVMHLLYAQYLLMLMCTVSKPLNSSGLGLAVPSEEDLRFREVKQSAKKHTASTVENQDPCTFRVPCFTTIPLALIRKRPEGSF